MGTPADQIVYLVGRLADHQLDDAPFAQAGTGAQGILDVILETVLGGHHARDAALGIIAVALLNAILGHDQDVEIRWNLEGGPQAGDARADHENVAEEMRGLLWAKGNQISAR